MKLTVTQKKTVEEIFLEQGRTERRVISMRR